jgi:hypothetical protein
MPVESDGWVPTFQKNKMPQPSGGEKKKQNKKKTAEHILSKHL